MSSTMPCSLPGINLCPGCHPKVEVESDFEMMSMFSASSAERKRTTDLAFSEVTVHPKSASTVMPRLVKIVLLG